MLVNQRASYFLGAVFFFVGFLVGRLRPPPPPPGSPEPEPNSVVEGNVIIGFSLFIETELRLLFAR
jgi:hypothetical protein